MPIKAQQAAADSLYFEAYTEIADMLDGKQPLSIKRSVLLESTYWTDVTEELDKQWDNEWETAPEPQILTREMYEQMKNKK